jgi:hypothetical protein
MNTKGQMINGHKRLMFPRSLAYKPANSTDLWIHTTREKWNLGKGRTFMFAHMEYWSLTQDMCLPVYHHFSRHFTTSFTSPPFFSLVFFCYRICCSWTMILVVKLPVYLEWQVSNTWSLGSQDQVTDRFGDGHLFPMFNMAEGGQEFLL